MKEIVACHKEHVPLNFKVPPSASTHGTTITVSMTVPTVQSLPAANPVKKPVPVKEISQKKKPVKPRKEKPRPVVKTKVAKPKPKVVEPVKEVIQFPAPEVDPEPEPASDEPVAQGESVAQVQETTTDTEETKESSCALAVGGAQADAQPTSVYAPEPNYPKAAIRRGYQGVVLLEILVNRKGEVKDVKMKKSSGHSVLDRSAVKGIKNWRFLATGACSPIWVTLPGSSYGPILNYRKI